MKGDGVSEISLREYPAQHRINERDYSGESEFEYGYGSELRPAPHGHLGALPVYWDGSLTNPMHNRLTHLCALCGVCTVI